MCLLLLDLRFAELQKSDDVALRTQIYNSCFSGLSLFTIALVVAIFWVTAAQINNLQTGDVTAQTSLSLLLGLYLPLFIMRMLFLLTSCLVLGYAAYKMYRLEQTPQSLLGMVYLSCLLILIGEIVGRFLFYATHIRIGI